MERNDQSRQILGSCLRINTDNTEHAKALDGRLVEQRGN